MMAHKGDGHAAGRGRNVETPRQMPARGWLDVLWRVKRQSKNDNISLIAGSVAFFALLAIFPALIATISIYGLVASPESVAAQLEAVSRVLPADARTVIESQLNDIVANESGGLGWGVALGILVALWSASSGTAKLIQAINIAYDETDERGFLAKRGLALLLTLGFIAGTILALALVAILPAVIGALGLGRVGEALITYGRWPLLALLMIFGLAVLYWLAPDRVRPRWQWVSWGSVIATLVFILASIGFSLYVRNFGKFGETYGAVAGIVVLLLWLFITSFVILSGAELNSELEAQTARDSTAGPPRRRGERGAVKADRIGERKPAPA